MAGVFQTLVAASFGWFLASSLWIYPHSLSYFNESIGGPLNGPKHLLGSNVDWGQDRRYLDCWLKGQRENNRVSIQFMGSIDRSTAILIVTSLRSISFGFTASAPGRFAISVNLLFRQLSSGSSDRNDEDCLPRSGLTTNCSLRDLQRIGYGICILQSPLLFVDNWRR